MLKSGDVHSHHNGTSLSLLITSQDKTLKLVWLGDKNHDGGFVESSLHWDLSGDSIKESGVKYLFNIDSCKLKDFILEAIKHE